MEATLPVQLLDDPVLRRFRTALDNTFSDRIERVVLFGSRARDEATERFIATWEDEACCSVS